jgi:hypothetical protein
MTDVPDGWKVLFEIDPLSSEAKSEKKREWHKSLLRQEVRKEDAKKCLACGKRVEHRKICTGCQQVVFYCDKSCQKEHWKVHKEECKKAIVAKNPLLKRNNLYTKDLGTAPSREVKDAAVQVYFLKAALGLHGADNPCPVFKDENGYTKFL